MLAAMSHSDPGSIILPTLALGRGDAQHKRDTVAVEEPLEIRVAAGAEGHRRIHPLAVTMRTPGDDELLALGFLLAEGIVRVPADVESISAEAFDAAGRPTNRVTVSLAPSVAFDPREFQRSVYTGSSCGICGSTSIERVTAIARQPPQGRFCIARPLLCSLPDQLLAAQDGFASTGGVHAAGLFSPAGEMLDLREDIGRHNAVDKVVGERFRQAALPASDSLLLVSGRAGFELVHKAAVAGIPMLAAVGAPSSLAVSLAKSLGMTLVGFLRGDRCNVYCGASRVDTG